MQVGSTEFKIREREFFYNANGYLVMRLYNEIGQASMARSVDESQCLAILVLLIFFRNVCGVLEMPEFNDIYIYVCFSRRKKIFF